MCMLNRFWGKGRREGDMAEPEKQQQVTGAPFCFPQVLASAPVLQCLPFETH